MPYRLGVDLGTTFTAAAVSDGVAEPTVIGLGNRALQVPSVLFLKPDGEFLVGEVAERRGLTEPDRLAREFKRRIGDHVPIMVAGAPFSPQALTSHLLRWVVGAASERMGGQPAEVILTHPANWGPFRLELLDQVAVMAGVGAVQRCTEPEAAAAQYASQTRVAPGDRVAVYDLGGGTFDACVLEKTDTGFRALGTPEGVEHLGGVDFDAAVLGHVLGALGANAAALDPEDPAVTTGLARLRRDCVEAKEALSTDVDTLVPVALPGLSTTVRVTRAEFELMIRPALAETLAAMGRALQSARVEASTLRGILLVGGSSRIPLVSELLTREFMVPTALDAHPKHDVALGSVRVGREPADVGPAPAPSNLQPVEGSAAGATLAAAFGFDAPDPVTPSPPNPARAVRPSASAPRGVARDTGSAGSPPPVEPLGAAAPANAGGAGAPSAGPDAPPLPGPNGMGPGTPPTGTGQPAEELARPPGGLVRVLVVVLAAVVLGVGAGVIIARRSGDKPTDGPSVTSSAPTSSTPVNSPTPSPTPTPTPARPPKWQPATDLPEPLEAAGVAAFGGAIWVIGGDAPSAGRPALDKVWVYKNGWQRGPSLPVRLDSMSVASDGKRLFVVGGRTSDSEGGNSKISRDVWVLDSPDDDSWKVLNRLPEERAGGAVAWDGQRLVFAGGVSRRDLNGDGTEENVNHDEVWVWEGKGEWRELGQLQRQREDLVAASDGNGRVWFLGGADVDEEDRRVPLGAVDLVEKASITPLSDIDPVRSSSAVWLPDRGACLFGGVTRTTLTNKVVCVPETASPSPTVRPLPPMTLPRAGMGAAVQGGTIWLAGGFGPERKNGPGRPGLSIVEVLVL